MRDRLLATLLHYANARPPLARREFYALKTRLLQQWATSRGHDLQEITKVCYGERRYSYYGDDSWDGCRGPTCRRCRGTGIFEKRWIRLDRYEWHGRIFHVPNGETRVPPNPRSVTIRGRIEHPDYGRWGEEAALWLFLLAGEWRLLSRALKSSWLSGWYAWPLLNLQRVIGIVRRKFHWRRCWECDRRFWRWQIGDGRCRSCRRQWRQARGDVPF